MTFVQYGILFCWLIFWVVWMLMAGFTKPVQEAQSQTKGLLYKVLLWIGFALLFSNFDTRGSAFVLFTHIIPNTAPVGYAGLIVTIVGLIAILSARYSLGSNWSVGMDVKEKHELVTCGLYAYIRHPIYAALLMMFFGSAVVFGTLGSVIGFILAIVSCLIRIHNEDALMAREFPDTHAAYVTRTKRLIPFVY